MTSLYKLMEFVDGNFKAEGIHDSYESAKKAAESYVQFYVKVLDASFLLEKEDKYTLKWKTHTVELQIKEY